MQSNQSVFKKKITKYQAPTLFTYNLEAWKSRKLSIEKVSKSHLIILTTSEATKFLRIKPACYNIDSLYHIALLLGKQLKINYCKCKTSTSLKSISEGSQTKQKCFLISSSRVKAVAVYPPKHFCKLILSDGSFFWYSAFEQSSAQQLFWSYFIHTNSAQYPACIFLGSTESNIFISCSFSLFFLIAAKNTNF